MNDKKKPSKFWQSLPQNILVLCLLLLCVLMLLPFFWSLSTSLRAPQDSFKMPPSFFPTSFEISNYQAVFTRFPFARFVGNSLLVSTTVVVLNLITTTMAAFAFARIEFRGKSLVFALFMSGMMIPAQATMVSLYLIISKMGLVNNLWAIILPGIISPLYIFLVRQFMATIPKSYEEAAEMDGCTRFGIYWRVIMPMSKPVIFLAALQVFLSSWNNFLSPLIYLTDWNKMTLPIGLRTLRGYMGMGNISEILAGVVVSLIVPILLYAWGQRYLIEGIALSGLKS